MNTKDPTNHDTASFDIDILKVFKTLRVGPVKLEPKRLIMPYQLETASETHETELIYKYDEAVFDSEEAASQNLGQMIGAQVALNYGLFCETIEFVGYFDSTDRRFIREMIENTAREIYVKKFLQPNPFLIGEASKLQAKVQKRFCQANLVFTAAEHMSVRPEWHHWQLNRDRHAVLSSGGKDSLLSFGLLREMGFETHPLFVNESGRHWFTALNAFRHLKDSVPETAKVWTNCDRVFNWFLRQMPFIKPNFADMRADIYPVRLWTVAVFLFGVMPLMRKRGIGRILIGDEYDTTVREKHGGISHFDGLFDQSRIFDNQLSRFFMEKGWAVSQFSILRPLSELLIETILALRYPDLQKHQTSCHATHVVEDRVYPCGKCEKCRRIVGMLSAMGVDPRNCGYNSNQIGDCLIALQAGDIHQEEAGVQHLFQLLAEKGLAPKTLVKKLPEGKKHMALTVRFHPQISPMSDIPLNLREPLYRIFGQYSEGFAHYHQRKWLAYDPFADPLIREPYAFEQESIHIRPDTEAQRPTYLWGELTWPEAQKRLEITDVAILPVGAIEQHGPHLPLDVDSFDADYLARRVAQACSNPPPLVLPLIPYGISYHHQAFAGTISVSNETLANMVYEVGLCVAQYGIKKLLILNGHGGNDAALNFAAQKINRDAHIFVCVDTGATSDVDIEALSETENDVHAGEIETSTTMAIRPHLVRMDLAESFVPQFRSQYLNFSAQRGISWHAYTEKISPTGVMGDPTKASVEKGRQMWEVMTAHLVSLVEDLKSMSLEDLYQKRY